MNLSGIWDAFLSVLASKSPWSAIFYFFAGALVTVYIAFKSQRPRLIISGGGSGGNQQEQRWTLTVTNRPVLFGRPISGEAAHDIHAWLRLREKDSTHYPIYWAEHSQKSPATLEPGQTQTLAVFFWFFGKTGYYVADQVGEPVAKFEDREVRFVLRLNDRIGRMTEFPFKVKFDDSNLKNPPRLSIVHPLSFEARFAIVKGALRQLVRAFRS